MNLNLVKYFDEAFNAKCILTHHAVHRLTQRFMMSELSHLKLLVQAALKARPLGAWKDEEPTVLIDPRFNLSILCAYSARNNSMTIITFIRGKAPESYKDCRTINVSILKEKAQQEAQMLNQKMRVK